MYHHRPGQLKQSHKAHKRGQHASKRAIDRKFHGRVDSGPAGALGRRTSIKSLSGYAARW